MQWMRRLGPSTALVQLFESIGLGLLDAVIELQGIPHACFNTCHDALQRRNTFPC